MSDHSDHSDHRSITAEAYEQMIAKAIAAHDFQGVHDLLKVMVSVHPREAVRVYDDIQAALRLRKSLRSDGSARPLPHGMSHWLTAER